MDIFETTANSPLFADYKTEQRPTGEVLEKYRELIPKELLEIWEEHLLIISQVIGRIEA